MGQREDVRRQCKKFLSYDRPRTARDALLSMAEYAGPDTPMDDYGKGLLHERLEQRLTTLLGKEAAVFMPTGRAAQLCGLKVWCERSRLMRVAMHPRCHMEEYESKGFRLAFGMDSVPIGHLNRTTSAADVTSLVDPVGAISIEFPMLSLGSTLPPWKDLVEISAWARQRKIPLHADGARLWEAQPYYGKSHAEICALFDSIYVSFYKGLNGIAGGAIAGPADFIAQVKSWQHRYGAAPPRQFPMLLDALRGLDELLPLMPAFHQKARSLARAFSELPGVRVSPNPPHATAFYVYLEGDPARLVDAAVEVSAKTGLWLVDYSAPTGIDRLAMFQVTVGTATLEVTEAEAAEAVAALRAALATGK